MRVRSEIDLWFKITIWISVTIMVMVLTMIPQNERLIGYLIGIPMLLIIVWIYFGTYYELRDKYLLCRCGPFFEKIPYEKIKSVKLSNNMLSSMALSLKRIQIRRHGRGYITGTTFISPQNREEFLKDLINRCTNLET